jgi:hypothetical protein
VPVRTFLLFNITGSSPTVRFFKKEDAHTPCARPASWPLASLQPFVQAIKKFQTAAHGLQSISLCMACRRYHSIFFNNGKKLQTLPDDITPYI